MAQKAPSTTSPPLLLIRQFPGATDISYRRLTCTTSGHNKYWEAWTCRAAPGGTTLYVYTRWGKIGSRSPGYRVGSYSSIGLANRVVQGKTIQKVGKGYIIVETGADIESINAFLTGTAASEEDPIDTEADIEADRNYGRFRGL